jgi:polyphosphate kinase
MSANPPVDLGRATPKRSAPRSSPHRGKHLTDSSLYLDRELSWLKFNCRVLDQARDATHPLLERVKFLAIAANNLDEFYMVRFAGLQRSRREGLDRLLGKRAGVDEHVRAVRAAAEGMLHDLERCWTDDLRPLLAAQGIHFLEPSDYTPPIQEFLNQHFNVTICPVLTPLAFDPGHPFPFMSNRSKNLAVVVRHRGRTRFARVKVANTLRRFIEIPPELTRQRVTFAFLEDVIEANLPDLFTGVEIVSAHLFRILRDSDIALREDDSDDLMESVGRGLQQVRHGALSLLQIDKAMPARVLNILIENFEIEPSIVVRSGSRIGFADWTRIARLRLPALKDAPIKARSFWRGSTPDELFEQLKYQDYLVHHPYDSFGTFEAFLGSAVRDPKVVAIKITLYRVGSPPPVVDLLLAAADAGKEVTVLVELKARFDERRNIEWAARLERAGVHVVYGVMKLKTHCKVCLVVRKGSDGIERYAHLATGNYNGVTATQYTDFGLFTSAPRLMADLSELFNFLTGYSNQVIYRELWVAPLTFRRKLRQLIAREAQHARAGRPARIIIKANALSDHGAIRDLYRASQAGVAIDLIVRGICCLRPGVPGISETIRVRSIVGRFLEHSRVFFFENDGSPEVYLASADLMERNLNRRVETGWRVSDPALCRYLRETVLESYLRDTAHASVLRADGEYERVEPEPLKRPFNAQRHLIRHPPPAASTEQALPERGDQPVSPGNTPASGEGSQAVDVPKGPSPDSEPVPVD